MSISEINASGYPSLWRMRKTQGNAPESDFASRMASVNTADDNPASRKANGKTAVKNAAPRDGSCVNETCEEPNAASDEQKAETDSKIIVKPDGSRVLMITMKIGGMLTSMSLRISEPTDMQNDISKRINDNGNRAVPEAGIAPGEIPEAASRE